MGAPPEPRFRTTRRIPGGHRKRHPGPVRPLAAVLGLIALHNHLRANRHRVLVEPAANQTVWRCQLDGPVRRSSVALDDVDIQPGVRVEPIDPGDGAFERDRPVRIELRGKRMVGLDRRTRDQHTRADYDSHHRCAHAFSPCRSIGRRRFASDGQRVEPAAAVPEPVDRHADLVEHRQEQVRHRRVLGTPRGGCP